MQYDVLQIRLRVRVLMVSSPQPLTSIGFPLGALPLPFSHSIACSGHLASLYQHSRQILWSSFISHHHLCLTILPCCGNHVNPDYFCLGLPAQNAHLCKSHVPGAAHAQSDGSKSARTEGVLARLDNCLEVLRADRSPTCNASAGTVFAAIVMTYWVGCDI